MVVRLLQPGKMPDEIYQSIALSLIQMVRTRKAVHRGGEVAREIVIGILNGEWELVRYFYKGGFQVVVAQRVDSAHVSPLSLRERQVVFLASQGCSNVAISRLLEIGEATVATHLRRAMRKMGGITRMQLIRLLPIETLTEEDIASLQIKPPNKKKKTTAETLTAESAES